jgi:hypothetical protein
VADEKHCDWQGKRVYLALTAAQGCILGVSLSGRGGQDGLTEAYGVFQHEADHHAPDYVPETTNVWDATDPPGKHYSLASSGFCAFSMR